MIRIRTAAAVILILSWLGAFDIQAASPSETSAHAVIEKTVNQVLDVLADKTKSSAQRLRSIEGIVYARFDLHEMSQLVLARNWRRFSEKQRAEYIDEFKKYLSNDYGNRIERYDQEKVKFLEARDQPRGDVIVKTRIMGGQFKGATVDYRLRKRTEEWRVIDVVIEGISIVSNFRDQFKSVVSRGGPELLLKKLREKNADALEKKKAAAPEETNTAALKEKGTAGPVVE